MEGRKDGRTEGRKEGRTKDKRTEGWKDGRTEGRELKYSVAPSSHLSSVFLIYIKCCSQHCLIFVKFWTLAKFCRDRLAIN